MEPSFRPHAIIVGALFVTTMLSGMVDASVVTPVLAGVRNTLPPAPTVLLGVFSVFFMSIGVVALATTLYPVVRRRHEGIALTYVAFRVVECGLLILGACLNFLLLPGPGSVLGTAIVPVVLELKRQSFQLAMVLLGLGSILLNASFLRSALVPRWLALWGIGGYALLFLSGVLDLLGIVDTRSAVGAILYAPGGLWELVVFPGWLFVRGFSVR